MSKPASGEARHNCSWLFLHPSSSIAFRFASCRRLTEVRRKALPRNGGLVQGADSGARCAVAEPVRLQPSVKSGSDLLEGDFWPSEVCWCEGDLSPRTDNAKRCGARQYFIDPRQSHDCAILSLVEDH